MIFYYNLFAFVFASDFMEVDVPIDGEKADIENTKSIEDINQLVMKSKECKNFIYECNKNSNNILINTIQDIVKRHVTPNTFVEFENFAKNKFLNDAKCEFSKVANILANSIKEEDNFVRNKHENAKLQLKFMQEIIEHNKNLIIKEDSKTILAMSDFINKDNKMAFYRYFESFLIDFENSNLTVEYYKIRNKLILTYQILNVIFSDCFKSKNFKNPIMNLIEKEIFETLKDAKTASTNYIHDFNESANTLFNKLHKNINAKLDNVFNNEIKSIDDQYEIVYCEVHKFVKYENSFNYSISWNNEKFRNIFLVHFKNSILEPLKGIWNYSCAHSDEILESSTEFLSEIQSFLHFKFNLFFDHVYTEMKKSNLEYEQIYLPLIQKLEKVFKHNRVFSKENINTLKNIMTAESLIVYNHGKFLFDYYKEVMNSELCNLIDFETFVEKNEMVEPVETLRIQYYVFLIIYKEIKVSEEVFLNFTKKILVTLLVITFQFFLYILKEE